MATLLLTIITNLFAELSQIPPPTPPTTSPPASSQINNNTKNNNVFSELNDEDTIKVKNILMTINGIIPNVILFALDILDKRLIKSYTYKKKHDFSTESRERENEKKKEEESFMFLVQSNTNTDFETGDVYYVHLKTWNCTCPDFIMQIISSVDDSSPEDLSHVDSTNTRNININNTIQNNAFGIPIPESGSNWLGGTLRNLEDGYKTDSVPVCKHIMACVLVAKVPNLFGRYCSDCPIQEGDEKGIYEVAGWCAR